MMWAGRTLLTELIDGDGCLLPEEVVSFDGCVYASDWIACGHLLHDHCLPGLFLLAEFDSSHGWTELCKSQERSRSQDGKEGTFV